MEAFRVLKFWRSAAAGTESASDGSSLRKTEIGTDDDLETDEEDSLFDLVFKSPDRVHVIGGRESAEKDLRLMESPTDVFLSKRDFTFSKPLSPVTMLRSTARFKVFMLGLGKSSKCEKTASNGDTKGNPMTFFSKSSKIERSNRFSVKCRVREMPSASILVRDNSLRSQLLNETFDYETSSEKSTGSAVPKYLKLIKPLYLKVSRRQSNKAKFVSSFTPSSSPMTAPVNLSPRRFCEGGRAGSFKILANRLGKSRSTSAAAGIAPPQARRRDDSLLEKHDGILNAILHCKKSYSSSSQEFSQAFGSSTDTSHEKLGHLARNSCEEQNRRSI